MNSKLANAEERHLTKFSLIAAQLILLAAVLHKFQIESQTLFQVALIGFSGFVVHYFAPLKFRLGIFLGLCWLAVIVVFGGFAGIFLIGIGLALIGACHLPASLRLRIATLVILGLILCALRADWIPVPSLSVIWPILGSMFMFRLIIYVYDQQHEKQPAPLTQRLCYFFLLPNVCFPLFPVIDYQTFRRTYYERNRHEIYQQGIESMTRGVLHLILYRFVYYALSMSPNEVFDLGDFFRYAVSGYALYLRVSGIFHLAIGMLQIFGFNLPRTNYFYFLSSSFTDFWRRINIYWKDFMLKVFYYPIYFRLRKRGNTSAMILATAATFVITWLLHSYQWFWIRGSFPLAAEDGIFWTVFGALMVANVLLESKFGRKRSISGRSWTWRKRIGLLLRTMGVFVAICLLWSLWTSGSFHLWFDMMATAIEYPTVADRRVIWMLVVGGLGFAIATLYFTWGRAATAAESGQPIPHRSVAVTIASLLLLTGAGQIESYVPYLMAAEKNLREGRSDISVTIARKITELTTVKLSGFDEDLLERGYYENLISVNPMSGEVWRVLDKWPSDWNRLEDTGVMRLTGDFQKFDLAPSMEIGFRDATLTTNRWGMRDRDYELKPPPGLVRVAVLGTSHPMGFGVNDDETFDAVMEAHHADKLQVLNFAVESFSPLQQLALLEDKVASFEATVVLQIGQFYDMNRAVQHIIELVLNGVDLRYDFIRELVKRAGVNANMRDDVANRRLKRFGAELSAWIHERTVEICRRHDMVPVYAYLPTAGERHNDQEIDLRLAAAERAGFEIIDLRNVYDGYRPEDIWIRAWDRHPNPLGHRLIGQALWEQLHGGLWARLKGR